MLLTSTLTALLSASAALASAPSSASGSRKPNIILILTDDQDVSTVKRAFLPRIHKHLVDHGVQYDNFFAPVSVCCPSRVSLLRTQYAHNHNITFVSQPWGGWEIFNQYGYVGKTLPDFLQASGYNTYYTGKLMNDHTEKNCESLPVSGFNSSDILVDPYTYDYWNPGFSRDSQLLSSLPIWTPLIADGPVKVHPGEYNTDLVNRKALDYLSDGIDGAHDRPFFLGVAPIACHSWIKSDRLDMEKHDIRMDIPASHPRHATMFPTEQLERKASFNPDEPQGVSWVKTLPKLNSTQEAYLDEFYRGRLRALQPVDELVEDIVKKLEAAGQLDNTYIFYTADNGYAIGTHRRQPGKTLGFEEDIHVPLLVRGPGIKKGFRDTLSSYGIVDLSRTILEIAGAKTVYHDDGVKINLHQDEAVVPEHKLARHSISEYWVLGGGEGVYAGPFRGNNTYRTLRVHDELHGSPVTYSYSVWCTGERELYDLVSDPYQINNLLKPLNALGEFADFDATAGDHAVSVLPTHLQKVLHRLDALLLVLKTCQGESCHAPYATIFPPSSFEATGGEVYRLDQALEEKYDAYFAGLPRVRYTHCALGYQTRLEKPDWAPELAFRGDKLQAGVWDNAGALVRGGLGSLL